MGQFKAMYLNDYDTSRLGLVVRRADGRHSGVSIRDRITQLPKRAGDVALARESEAAPRRLTVLGTIKKSSIAAVNSARDELKARLYHGTIEVRFDDEPTRMYLARAEDSELRTTDPDFVNPASEVTLSLYVPVPLAFDKLSRVVAFSATKGDCPIGTAPSLPVLQVAGAVTNPTITYRDFRGASIKTLGLTVTLLATEYLEIDCETSKIYRYTAGVKANADSLMSSGDFFALDSQDADTPNSVWPTLEISPTAACKAIYRRAWL